MSAAPVLGSDPQIDPRHDQWLHLRVRPTTVRLLTISEVSFQPIAKFNAFFRSVVFRTNLLGFISANCMMDIGFWLSGHQRKRQVQNT